jgi:catechol 2,3-dioxygenase
MAPAEMRMARFYSTTYDMDLQALDKRFLCRAPGRPLTLSEGPANRLEYAHYAFHSSAAWDTFTVRT